MWVWKCVCFNLHEEQNQADMGGGEEKNRKMSKNTCSRYKPRTIRCPEHMNVTFYFSWNNTIEPEFHQETAKVMGVLAPQTASGGEAHQVYNPPRSWLRPSRSEQAAHKDRPQKFMEQIQDLFKLQTQGQSSWGVGKIWSHSWFFIFEGRAGQSKGSCLPCCALGAQSSINWRRFSFKIKNSRKGKGKDIP